MEISIKYSPTEQLITNPLDRIERPWQQPKRRTLTAYWKPDDAKRFVTYLAESLGARIFSENSPNEFFEVKLAEIEFHPELKHDLLFTNVDGVTISPHRDPEKVSPFIRLSSPFHMLFSLPRNLNFTENTSLLHYIKYSHEVVRSGTLEKQPAQFLAFAHEACTWLNKNYVSLRGRNTADNPEEYLKLNRNRT